MLAKKTDKVTAFELFEHMKLCLHYKPKYKVNVKSCRLNEPSFVKLSNGNDLVGETQEI